MLSKCACRPWRKRRGAEEVGGLARKSNKKCGSALKNTYFRIFQAFNSGLPTRDSVPRTYNKNIKGGGTLILNVCKLQLHNNQKSAC